MKSTILTGIIQIRLSTVIIRSTIRRAITYNSIHRAIILRAIQTVITRCATPGVTIQLRVLTHGIQLSTNTAIIITSMPKVIIRPLTLEHITRYIILELANILLLVDIRVSLLCFKPHFSFLSHITITFQIIHTLRYFCWQRTIALTLSFW
jgi:hypothetical protein